MERGRRSSWPEVHDPLSAKAKKRIVFSLLRGLPEP